MSQYPVENIRTVALVGHGSTGKTTLLESLLYRNGVIKEVGTVEKGNTVGDFHGKRSQTLPAHNGGSP